jgi:hypothetical protein
VPVVQFWTSAYPRRGSGLSGVAVRSGKHFGCPMQEERETAILGGKEHYDKGGGDLSEKSALTSRIAVRESPRESRPPSEREWNQQRGAVE